MLYVFFIRNRISTVEPEISTVAMGILTSDDKVIAQYQAFADYLNKYSGVQWYVVPVKDAGSFIEQIENHKIKSAFVGSAVGYRIIKNNLGFPVARGEQNGISTYDAYVIAKKDSGIESIEDLRNKRFAYVDINMTSGYLFPAYLLRSLGHDPDIFFRASSFLKTTSNVVDAVISGNFDGGAVKSLDLLALIEKDPGIQDKINVIEKGGSYPNNTFMLSVDLDDQTAAKIQNLLLTMNNSEEGRLVLENMDIDRFIKTSNSDFREVEKIMNF
jgi:phosphonate transport system substrate-binding protein